MESQRASSSQVRFCAEVPVTCIPANYRKHLPKRARLCSVEEPVWDRATRCYVTRIGGTPEYVTRCHPLHLSEEEANLLFDALDTALAPQPISVAPSYLLPGALAELDTSRSSDLTGEMEQAMLDHALTSPPRLHDRWYIAPTELTDPMGRHMVRATQLSHRLSGRSSGPVYTVWMDDAALAQAMPIDRAFETHDAHTQRVAVAAFALAHGAKLPVDEPEPPREVGLSAATLEEDYQLVATKDPIYLRQEDVLAIDPPESSLGAHPILNSQEIILSNALAAIEQEQAYLRAVIEQRVASAESASSKRRVALYAQQRADEEQCERLALLRESLREALHWYRHLPRGKPRERILVLSPLTARETPLWRTIPDAAFRLIVGVPLILFEGREHLEPIFRRPRWAMPATGGSPPIPVGHAARIVA
jgi:hypothetical protein